MISDALMQKIAADSLVSLGDNQWWARMFSKKNITVGFMGGSVTQGYAQQHYYENAYPKLVAEGLREMGYGVKVCLCAAAGMNSMQGNALADTEILANTPDIVFLEYAINEMTVRSSVVSFESLLRKMLSYPKPLIVVPFMIRTKLGYSCESYMLPMAAYYGLPSVSLSRGFSSRLESGEVVWEEYGDAENHPSEDGHKLLAACLMNLLRKAKEIKPGEVFHKTLPEPWLDAPYANLRFYPIDWLAGIQTDFTAEPRKFSYFHRAWVGAANKGQTLTLDVTCKTVVLFFECHRLECYGTAKLLVDGKEVQHPLLNQSILHCNSIYGWGNAMEAVIANGDTPTHHHISVTPLEAQTYLLGFGIC